MIEKNVWKMLVHLSKHVFWSVNCNFTASLNKPACLELWVDDLNFGSIFFFSWAIKEVLFGRNDHKVFVWFIMMPRQAGNIQPV